MSLLLAGSERQRVWFVGPILKQIFAVTIGIIARVAAVKKMDFMMLLD